MPVFRDDDDRLLAEPWHVSVITAPAVNTGAVRRNERSNIYRIEATMIDRIEGILSVAVVHRHDTIVLGAWGCGVFQNDPIDVANWFHAHLLENDTFQGVFRTVVFAIRSQIPAVIRPFAERFAGDAIDRK